MEAQSCEGEFVDQGKMINKISNQTREGEEKKKKEKERVKRRRK